MSIVEVVRKTTAVVEVAHPGVQGPPGTGGSGGAVDSVNGRPGAVVLTSADVGLSNVNNTSDASKPVSTAQAAADTAVATAASNALAAHVAAADPHTGYALESSLAAVATSGAYADLTGKPTLGTAAPLNVAASGDAASGEVVKGSDSRLTDARTPTTHTHTASQISDSTAAGRAVLTAADAAAQRTALGVPAGSGNSTGTNTGDQTNITGNAGTATALQTARNINGVAFDGTANITINAVDSTARVAKAGDTLTGALNWSATQTIASAATTDIGAATSNVVIISGTTPITGLGTIAAGAERVVQFSGALTLTHNATSLILPGAASITTAAGDVAYFVSLGAGNWRCTGYQKANGQAVVASGGTGDFKSDGTVAGTGNFTTTGSMRADGGFSVNGDTLLQRVSAANWRLGAADASAPVAQTLSVQNVIAGTSNTAGADRTYLGSASTGNAVGGGHVFKTTPAGSSGSAQNSQATAMTIAGSGNVGIGQTTPTAGLHIDTAARSATGLKISTALGQDLFNYLKPGGTSLFRAVWDGSNFHHYLNSANIYVHLNGGDYTFYGNGLSSTVAITEAQLYLNSTNSNLSLIRCGTSSYATAGNPLTAIVPMELITWAWNGVDGYSVTSSSKLVQTQLSATNGDARLAIKNSANTDVFGINLLTGNVGIANAAPGEKLDVTGNIKSSGFQRTTPVTVATLIAAATAGAGARHSVTDSTVAASGNFGAAVTGGGSNIVPVYSDGTSWRIG